MGYPQQPGQTEPVDTVEQGSGSPSPDDATMTHPPVNQNGGGPPDGGRAASTLKVRKRTKTGCLTCRRRRIKCGEERPTCKNCTKSKRECEGYIPRVVFKDAFRPEMGALQDHHYYGQHGYHGSGAAYGAVTSVSADGVPLATIAPRPSAYDPYAGATQNKPTGGPFPYPNDLGRTGHDPRSQYHKVPGEYDTSRQARVPLTGQYPPFPVPGDHEDRKRDPTTFPVHAASTTQARSYSLKANQQSPTDDWPQSASAASMQFPTPLTNTSTDGTFPLPTWPTPDGNAAPAPVPQYNEAGYIVSPTLTDDFLTRQVHDSNYSYGIPTQSSQWKSEPADDWFDVDSDEENANMNQHYGEPNATNLGLMIKMSAQQNNPSIRSITNFLNGPNMLATYTPIYSASPLMDPQTARVFCHFIAATGPTLNVFERHPSNPSVIFSGHPPPESLRSLWSYTMPMLALTHRGLLHAMLALSSLHIAKIQGTSPTPSLKHYHYALRRVAKALGRHEKRRHVATLAATLLLGFYEVTTAEHNKWNSHLSGARELIMEIDYVSPARRIEFQRERHQEVQAKAREYDPTGLAGVIPNQSPSLLTSKPPQRLDADLIGTISGWTIRYDRWGPQSSHTQRSTPIDQPIRQSEIEEFDINADLFWWYAKQDVYQSILSGNRLLLPYERWGACPPRASMGRQDAAYGTTDHLLLLMARLAEYAAKDLPRKRRAATVKEQQMKAQNHAASVVSSGQPAMYGMIPDPGPTRVPSGFDQRQHDRIYGAPVPSEKQSLDIATAEAEAEHAAISRAFDVFEKHFGPAFAPLEPEHMTPMSSPFGPAIYYRSFSIACIVSLYYCGRIILCRTAPSMPPAAMAAAGVSAAATAGYGNTIGRISAGIQPVSNTAPLNPQHGAALMDSCMGLFHAGVQYRDAAQRGWLITKLRDIARLTGWQTSALIASGCERAWTRLAVLGVGPPYERTMNPSAKDDRIAGRSRDPRLLANPPRDNNDRRYVKQNAGTRVYWAMGILSVEEDMQELTLEEEQEEQRNQR